MTKSKKIDALDIFIKLMRFMQYILIAYFLMTFIFIPRYKIRDLKVGSIFVLEYKDEYPNMNTLLKYPYLDTLTVTEIEMKRGVKYIHYKNKFNQGRMKMSKFARIVNDYKP